MANKWKPLINDTERCKHIFEIIESISSFLYRKDFKFFKNNYSLFDGTAGVALFYAYYSKLSQRENLLKKAVEIIENSVDAIPLATMSFPLSSGFTGITWTMQHLVQNNFIDTDLDDLFKELDEIIVRESEICLKNNFYDYMHGGLGYVLYFGKKGNKNIEILTRAFHLLRDNAVQLHQGLIKWPSDFLIKFPDELGNDKKEFNLGLSHGNPSIVMMLCKLYKIGVEKQMCKKLIEGSMRWLYSNKRDELSLYPYVEGDKRQSALAWCYGDLGIAITFWEAGDVLNNKIWKDESIKILYHSCKRRDYYNSGLTEIGLCHGTIGAGHIFNRFYQKTGIDLFAETANYWYDLSIKLIDINKNKNNILFKMANDPKEIYFYGHLLEGVAGVGLSLISAISDIEPKWDECLLMS